MPEALLFMNGVLGLSPGAGLSPRRARYFSLLRQRKVPKRKATPSLRPLRFATGQTCGVSVAGCAVELTALRCSFVQTSTASQSTKHARCDARATPQPPRRRRSQQGWDSRTSKQPTSTRAVAALGPACAARGACARETGPSEAKARVAVLSPVPLWMRRGAQGLADQGSRVSERRAAARVERDPAKPEHRRLPRSEAQGTQTVGSLSLGETRESYSPAGRLPASALKESMSFDAHKPPRLSAHTRRMKPSISAGNLQPRRDGVHYKNNSCQGMKH